MSPMTVLAHLITWTGFAIVVLGGGYVFCLIVGWLMERILKQFAVYRVLLEYAWHHKQFQAWLKDNCPHHCVGGKKVR